MWVLEIQSGGGGVFPLQPQWRWQGDPFQPKMFLQHPPTTECGSLRPRAKRVCVFVFWKSDHLQKAKTANWDLYKCPQNDNSSVSNLPLVKQVLIIVLVWSQITQKQRLLPPYMWTACPIVTLWPRGHKPNVPKCAWDLQGSTREEGLVHCWLGRKYLWSVRLFICWLQPKIKPTKVLAKSAVLKSFSYFFSVWQLHIMFGQNFVTFLASKICTNFTKGYLIQNDHKINSCTKFTHPKTSDSPFQVRRNGRWGGRGVCFQLKFKIGLKNTTALSVNLKMEIPCTKIPVSNKKLFFWLASIVD